MSGFLEFSDITYHYGDRAVLRDVSLSVQKGSCTALIGPNGVGKTTLLRLASGALKPGKGEVSIGGRAVSGLGRKERSKLVALIPQQLEVPFEFTVQQIVEQGRSPYLGMLRGSRREDRLAVDKALDLADVTGLRGRVFNELSGGEKQRVKIALGLAQEPQLLLLDEPTQSLDIGRQAELIDLLHFLRDTGLTVYASIHDLHLVPDNFDRVHLLGPDNSHASGTPGELLTISHLTRAFHCSPGRHPLLMEAR